MGMSFANLVKMADNACLRAFGCKGDGIAIVYAPQDGSAHQTIDGIIGNPAMADDYVPGSSQGTSVVRLFVRFAELSPLPRKGDRFTIGGISYVTETPNVDPEGGAMLRLRAV